MTTSRAANWRRNALNIGVWAWRIALVVIGVVIGSISVVLFMAPFNIAPAGVTGVSVLLNTLFGTPIGLVIFILNIPIQMLGYRFLGGWRVVFLTVLALVLYSVLLDVIAPYLPQEGLSTNVLLNAIFGGVTGGLATGLIQRAGGTFGGTATIALILQRQLGTPMSTTYLYTDTLIIVGAGFIYGWEAALYAIIALFISGIATDYVLEGPAVIRTVLIVTDKPREVADAILNNLQRGVTSWEGRGMYTNQERTVLYVTVSRSQVNPIREIISSVDDQAFIVVGQGHTAYGRGFRRVRKPNP